MGTNSCLEKLMAVNDANCLMMSQQQLKARLSTLEKNLWLTNSLTALNLIDVILGCEGANSKLVVTVADVDA